MKWHLKFKNSCPWVTQSFATPYRVKSLGLTQQIANRIIAIREQNSDSILPQAITMGTISDSGVKGLTAFQVPGRCAVPVLWGHNFYSLWNTQSQSSESKLGYNE